jgi:hypothetical protein
MFITFHTPALIGQLERCGANANRLDVSIL